jgi:hypothetical protein
MNGPQNLHRFLTKLNDMIDIVGPAYCYHGEQLTLPEIIVVRDHHYNEQQQCFPIQSLLENSQCNPRAHVIIFDHVLQHHDKLQDYQLISFPSFLARENTEFIQQKIQPDWSNKTTTFNFMINKPRPHRFQLLEMIEEFGLTNYCHSLAWQTNPINNIPVTDYCFGPEVVMERGVRNGSFRNAHTYQSLLQTTVFEPTCISLITEPAYYERETIITEKTIMSMYAGTIPVWVGGWRIPDYLEQAGFDTFDDIVDHSYQDLADPADRCRRAVELNLDLLRQGDLAKRINLECHNRLKKNIELLETNYFRNKCLTIIDQYSGTVQHILQQIFRPTEDIIR